jgi:hypothetical protein
MIGGAITALPKVRYRDLNLNTEWGNKVLYQRIVKTDAETYGTRRRVTPWGRPLTKTPPEGDAHKRQFGEVGAGSP